MKEYRLPGIYTQANPPKTEDIERLMQEAIRNGDPPVVTVSWEEPGIPKHITADTLKVLTIPGP